MLNGKEASKRQNPGGVKHQWIQEKGGAGRRTIWKKIRAAQHGMREQA